MACSSKKCKCSSEFVAHMGALWQVYDGIGAKADVVAIAWEREDGKVFRYDLPIPQRLDPQAAKKVSHVVDRIAKFIVWSAGGWKLYLAGPDAVVQPVAKAYTKKGARKFDYGFFKDLYGKPFEVNTGAISRGYRTHPYPSRAMLRYIAQKGGSVILSGDSHSKDALCCAFEKWYAACQKIGVNVVWDV